MSTTTKSKRAADPAAEFYRQADASRQRLEQRRGLAQQRAEEVAAAEAALSAIHAAWRSGDDTVPAAAEPLAVSALHRAQALHADAVTQEGKAGAEVISTDTRLAEAVAPLVAAVLKVQPSALPFVPSEAVAALPCAVVVQAKAASLDSRTGRLTGTVDVHWTRHDVHREASPALFVDAAEDHGVSVSTAYLLRSVQQGESFVEVVRLDASVVPPVPSIARPDVAGAAREVARDIAADVTQRNRYAAADGPRTGFDTGQRSGVLTWTQAPRVVSDTTDGNGLRSVTFDVEVSGRPAEGTSYTLAAARESIGAVVEEQAGRSVPALGRITSAHVLALRVAEDAASGTDAVTVTARLVAVSAAEGGDEQTQMTAPRAVRGSAADPRDRDAAVIGHPGAVAL